MKNDMPTGVPFELKRTGDYFSHTILFKQRGWSKQCIDWLNYESYNDRFRKSDGSYYRMHSGITGEHTFYVGNKEISVDGYVETADKKYYFEYYGCRLELFFARIYMYLKY